MGLTDAYFLIFNSSKLPNDILTGSPSLLWLATDSGDENSFQNLLQFLDGSKRIPDSGGTTVLEIALSKGHDMILGMAMEKRLYSR